MKFALLATTTAAIKISSTSTVEEEGPSCKRIADAVWHHCDANGDGSITWKEAKGCGAPDQFEDEFKDAAGKDGHLSRGEFMGACRAHGGKAQVEEEGPSCKRIAKAVWDHCDGDDDGKITWGEAKACGAPKSFKPAFLHVAGKDKAVDHGEFMAACKAHGGEAQEEVEEEGPSCKRIADAVWHHCDANGDGSITWKEAKGCGAPDQFEDEFKDAAGKDGHLSRGEFMGACKAHGGKAQVEEEGPSCKRIAKAVWDHCDADDDGKITWGEAKACGAPKSFKPAFLHVAGKDKAVDHGEFMAACKAHGGEAQEEVEVEGPPCKRIAHHIWKHCDANGDKTISWDEASGCGAPDRFKPEFEKAAGKDGELSRKEFMKACRAH